jgi:hypothetical protein
MPGNRWEIAFLCAPGRTGIPKQAHCSIDTLPLVPAVAGDRAESELR